MPPNPKVERHLPESHHPIERNTVHHAVTSIIPKIYREFKFQYVSFDMAFDAASAISSAVCSVRMLKFTVCALGLLAF
jgi:hypothetical protein